MPTSRSQKLPLVCAIVALVTAALPLRAQKVERESRLREREVPAAVFRFLDSAFVERRRLKFFQDFGQDGTTVEAKFLSAGRHYSVEFTPEGRWRDTESQVELAEVPAVVWSQACGEFDRRFERYRVVRVQRHRSREGAVYYEVELSVRIDFEWTSFQYRIAPDGAVLEAIEIELSPGHLSRW